MDEKNDKLRAMIADRIEHFYDENPFVKLMKLQVDEISSGMVVLRFDVDDIYTNFYGIAHGGALMSATDTAMGAACLSLNKKVVTTSFNMNFIKPIYSGNSAKIVGSVLHDGSRTMVCEASVMDEEGQLAGKANASFLVIGEFCSEAD